MTDSAGIGDLLLKWRELKARGEPVEINRLCGERVELRAELERQVRAIEQWEALLEIPGDSCEATLPHDAAVDGQVRSAATVGRTLAGHELLEVLGEGGMGVVFKARQASLDRLVALKTLAHSRPGSKQLVRFQVEAAVIAKLHHPHIVQVYDLGEAGGLPFFTMELIAGGNLAQRLAVALPGPRRAAELIRTLACAIQAVHERGIIHRDLKPVNVLLLDSNSARSGPSVVDPWRDCVPKISDFGLAKQLDDDASPTQTGEILGTPSYMAPEQADGRTDQVGPPTDVYALGAILYELLTGRAPLGGAGGLGALHRISTEEPESPRRLAADVPRDLEAICLKCLEKRPERRYRTAAALGDDLAAFLNGHRVAARHATWLERGVKWTRRHPARALSTLVLIALAGAATWAVGARLRERQVLRDAAAAAAPQAREILKRHCWECHGADPADVKRNLPILDRATLLDPERKVVAPFDPSRSRLVRRIEDGSMPPEEEELRLPRVAALELEILRTWIAGGAPPFPDEDPARPTPPVVAYSKEAAEAKRIFAQYCFECHRSSVAKGGIKILNHDLLVFKREMVVPGRPDESPLMRHFDSDSQLVMPPPPRPPLTEEEQAAIRRWIEAGAPPFP